MKMRKKRFLQINPIYVNSLFTSFFANVTINLSNAAFWCCQWSYFHGTFIMYSYETGSHSEKTPLFPYSTYLQSSGLPGR